MRTVRHLIETLRRLGGRGAAHNARLELAKSEGSVVELDRQLRRVGPPGPPRAA